MIKAYRELSLDEDLKEGDEIVIETAFNTQSYTVIKLTNKKYAIIKYNEKAEGKFPKQYVWNFKPVSKQKWDTNKYKVYRELEKS